MATIIQSVTNMTETSVMINWVSDTIVDYIWFSTDDGATWTGLDVADGTKGTYTISGMSPNTTYLVKTKIRAKNTQTTTISNALEVTTYNYPYAEITPNVIIGKTLTIELYNPLGRNITVQILSSNDTLIASKTTTSTKVSGFNDVTTINNFYSTIPTTTYGIYKVRVTSGTSVMVRQGGRYSINHHDCTPVIGTVSYEDTNATATALTGNDQDIIRNVSTVKYTATGLAAKKSATIVSCNVIVNGETIGLTMGAGSAVGTGGVIDSSEDIPATFVATDSRGLTSTKTCIISMLDWYNPQAVVSAKRQNKIDTATDLLVNAKFASINGSNQISINYTATSDSGTVTTGSLTNGTISTVNLSNSEGWRIIITLVDSLGGTNNYNAYITKGMPIIYIDRIKSSIGINCIPLNSNSLELNGISIAGREIITASLSLNTTSYSANTYNTILLNSAVKAGNKLILQNDGGILVGAGVSKILISGRANVQSSSSSGIRYLRIVKNSSGTDNILARASKTIGASVTETLNIPPQLVDITPNDVIYLHFYPVSTSDTLVGYEKGSYTLMTIEVIK